MTYAPRFGLTLLLFFVASATAQQPPGFDDPELTRAFEMIQAGQLRQAVELLDARLQDGQQDSETLYVSGLAAAAVGDTRQALEFYKGSLMASPDSRAAREMGLMLGAGGNSTDCLLLLREWFAAHPQDHVAGGAAASCALQSGRPRQVRDLLGRLPAGAPMTRLIAGRLSLFESDPEGAIATLEPALEGADPRIGLEIRRTLAEAHLAVGRASRAAELLEGHAATAAVAVLLGQARLQNGDLNGALRALEPWAAAAISAGAEATSSATAHVIREYGRALLQANRPTDALPYLEASTRIATDDADAWRLLAQALTASGDTPGGATALARFQELAAEAEPDSVLDQRARRAREDPTGEVLRQAVALTEQEKHDEALGLLAQESRIATDDARPRILAARILTELGRGEQALVAARSAVAVEPNSAMPYYELGHVLGLMQRFEDAAVAYNVALARQPEYPAALVELAAVEATLGRRAEALSLLERALALEPDNEPALRLRRQLDESK